MTSFSFLDVCGSQAPITSSKSRRTSFAQTHPSPSVFDDSLSMISAALSIYVFADLRELARGSDTSLSFEEFEPPMDVEKNDDVA